MSGAPHLLSQTGTHHVPIWGIDRHHGTPQYLDFPEVTHTPNSAHTHTSKYASEETFKRYVHDSVLPALTDGFLDMRHDNRKEFQALGERVRSELRKELSQFYETLADGGTKSTSSMVYPRYNKENKARTSKIKRSWTGNCMSRADTADLRQTGKTADSRHSGKATQATPLNDLSVGNSINLSSEPEDECMAKAKSMLRKRPITKGFDDDNMHSSVSKDFVPLEPPPLLPMQIADVETIDDIDASNPILTAWEEELTRSRCAASQADKAAGSPSKGNNEVGRGIYEADLANRNTNNSHRESKVTFENDSDESLAVSNQSPGNFHEVSSGQRFRELQSGPITIAKEAARRAQMMSEKPWHSYTALEALTSSQFDNVIGMMILLNALTIGLQTNYLAKNMTDMVPAYYSVFEYMFLVVFTSELVFRIYVFQFEFFYMSENRFWNWFDFFVVLAQLTEECLLAIARSSNLEMTSNFRLLRVMRILRLMRILRVMRVLRLIQDLRKIVSSIAGSMKALGWTIVLLLLMIYIVGVYFTQTISEHMVDITNDGEALDLSDDRLNNYFGTLPRTILTLYQAIVGGIDWDTLSQPIIDRIGWVHGLALAGYVAFALLALMNVVTGVFVQTALQSAKDEEDEFLTQQVIGIFRATDVDHSLSLSWPEVEAALDDKTSAVFFSSIDLSPEDARELFKILDIDSSGEVCFEDFLQGCLRLRGPAKSKDMLEVMQACKTMINEMALARMHDERVANSLPQMRREIEDAASQLSVDFNSRLDDMQDEQRSMRSMKRTLKDIECHQREIVNGLRVITSWGEMFGASADVQLDPTHIIEASEVNPRTKLQSPSTFTGNGGELV